MKFYLIVLFLAGAFVTDIHAQPGGGGFGQDNFGGQGGDGFAPQGAVFVGQGASFGGPFRGQVGQFRGQSGPIGGQGGPFRGQVGPFGGLGGLLGGGFPGGLTGFPGGLTGFPGQGGTFPSFGQNGFQMPQILTCIGTNEAADLLKITLRPEPGTIFPPQMQQRRELQRQTWRISAVYIPAASLGNISPGGTTSLVGQFFLGVTRYGRTDGSCAGLGGILQNDDTVSGSSDLYHSNPYLQALRNLQSLGQPAGYIQDPIVISQGGNVYSGVVRDLTEVDLRGRGIAVCLDYLCQRPTTTCCTLAKDTSPATEQIGPVVSTGPISGNLFAGVSGMSPGAGGSGLISVGGASSGGLF